MNEQLKQLIAAACQNEVGTVQWRIGMHRFLVNLQQLPGIKTSSHPDYLAALNQTWEWVTRNICTNFVPRSPSLEQSLVNWINGYLYWRIKDLYLANTKKPLSLDVAIGDSEPNMTFLDNLATSNSRLLPTLNGLDSYIANLQKQRNQDIAMSLETYIQQDPERKLSSCFPSTYDTCNCQILAQKRLLQDPPDTFLVLATQLKLPQQKITNHWYGRCKPLLKKIAQDLGYQPELKS